MIRKLATYIIKKLTPLTYQVVQLKNRSINIEAVPGLVVHYKGKDRQLYKFVNEVDAPANRLIFLKAFEREKDMRIGVDLLKEFIDKTLTANNEGNTSGVGHAQLMLLDIIENLTPIDAIYNQAALLYFDEDEDISQFDADWQKAKVEAFKNHPDQAFFLRTLLRHLGISGELSIAEIQDSFKKDQVKMAVFLRQLSNMKGSNATTSSRS